MVKYQLLTKCLNANVNFCWCATSILKWALIHTVVACCERLNVCFSEWSAIESDQWCLSRDVNGTIEVNPAGQSRALGYICRNGIESATLNDTDGHDFKTDRGRNNCMEINHLFMPQMKMY